jgi:hypothetical protein
MKVKASAISHLIDPVLLTILTWPSLKSSHPPWSAALW